MLNKSILFFACLLIFFASAWAWADQNDNAGAVWVQQVPMQNRIAVEVSFSNPEPIVALVIPLVWNQEGLHLESINYDGSRVKELFIKTPSKLYQENEKQVILYCISEKMIKPGDGLFATLYFSTDDSWNEGTPVSINTFSTEVPGHQLLFMGLSAKSYHPTFKQVSIDEGQDKEKAPSKFVLHQNYPNPFNPQTAISFEVKEATEVKVTIYNTLGQKIKELGNEVYAPGVHRITWKGTNENGQQVSSGIYFYRIQAGDFTATEKMIMMK
jgi:hypothetical protein